MLALHLLQSSLVLINTQLLTAADRRGLSPLFWSHANPYGRFQLDMDSRLDITRR